MAKMLSANVFDQAVAMTTLPLHPWLLSVGEPKATELSDRKGRGTQRKNHSCRGESFLTPHIPSLWKQFHTTSTYTLQHRDLHEMAEEGEVGISAASLPPTQFNLKQNHFVNTFQHTLHLRG